MVQPTKHAPSEPNPLEPASQETHISQPAEQEVGDSFSESGLEKPDRLETGIDKRGKSSTSSRARRRMHCFECNRKEGHFLASQRRWFYSFLLGLTFGLIKIVGPYQCQCCGSKRLMMFNQLNPRFWYRYFRNPGLVSSRKRS